MSALQTAVPARELDAVAGAQSASTPAEATRRLYERHQRRILAYCMSRLGNRQESEDAVQNTFVYAFRLLERGVVPEAELPWLFTIAHNVCRSRKRALRRRGRVETPADFDAFEDAIGVPDSAAGRGVAGLSEALASIPETQRRALLLREWQGLSYAEIGATLSLSQSAVETLLFRARRSVAKQLASSYDRVAVMLNGFMLLRFARRLARTGIGTKATAAALAAGVVAGAGIPLEHAIGRHPHSTRAGAVTPALAARTAGHRILRPVRTFTHSGSTAAGAQKHAQLETATAHVGAAVPQTLQRPPRNAAPTPSPASAPPPPPPTSGHGDTDVVRSQRPKTQLGPSPQPLDQTADHVTSALSHVVTQAPQTVAQTASRAGQTVSQAVQQTGSTVSAVVSSATTTPDATTGAITSDPPAAAATAAQQTVTTIGSTASSTVSQLLGQGRQGP